MPRASTYSDCHLFAISSRTILIQILSFRCPRNLPRLEASSRSPVVYLFWRIASISGLRVQRVWGEVGEFSATNFAIPLDALLEKQHAEFALCKTSGLACVRSSLGVLVATSIASKSAVIGNPRLHRSWRQRESLAAALSYSFGLTSTRRNKS